VKNAWHQVRTVGRVQPYLPMYFFNVPVVAAVVCGHTFSQKETDTFA